MPCTAKKAEILRPEHYTDGEQNVDYVLTTTEITRMIKEAGIDLAQIKPDAMDKAVRLVLWRRCHIRRYRRCNRKLSSDSW